MSQSQRAHNRCRERIEALADAARADDARLHAIVALRPVLGFERWRRPPIDPDSALSVAGIGEVDFWPSLARLVALDHGLRSRRVLIAGFAGRTSRIPRRPVDGARLTRLGHGELL